MTPDQAGAPDMIRHRYGWMRWSGVLIALVLLAILGTALGFACAVWWAS